MSYSPAIQAAGHDGAMQSASGELFVKPNAVAQEVEFYQTLASGKYPDLEAITCVFMGVLTEQDIGGPAGEQLIREAEQTQDASKLEEHLVPAGNGNSGGIVLENALYGYTEPNVLDVKLGSILFDDSASQEKRERLEEVSRTTTSGSLHLRVAGMNIYDESTKQRKWYDKFFGRNLTKEGIVDGLAQYFPKSMEPEKCRVLCEGIKRELEFMSETLHNQELRMTSSSVLIIYEGDSNAFETKLAINNQKATELDNADEGADDEEEEEEEEEENDKLFTVKLIDFAHTRFTPGEGPDTDSLTGLDNLITIFKDLEKRYDN
uniref:Kinase n=1 Tax=Blastobotrys adeninivorans TaxID=409370 RepID=A0A060TDB1_BLAAD